MQKNEDGSVTFTKKEYDELSKAYQGLHKVLDSFPSTLSDFFDRRQYVSIEKWYQQLQGRTFHKSDLE
jgi:hypothetical protein